MPSPRVHIKKEVLVWAMKRARTSPEELEKDFHHFPDWLEEKEAPTVKQLHRLSSKLMLPFGYFFLKEPPEEEEDIPWFRSIVTDQEQLHPNVTDTVRILERRQEWLHNYLEDNGNAPLPFVGKAEGWEDDKAIVQDIRETLALEPLWASAERNWEKALDRLTDALEEQGIIVEFNGVVGQNTQRPIPVEECRGFVLVDDLAPFLFVNNQDAKAAQMFTIAHELAHLWLGHSAGFDNERLQPADDPIERLCDQVAAEFLVPEDHFHEEWTKRAEAGYLAKKFKVSPIVIGRRAWDLGYWNKRRFFAFYKAHMAKFQRKKEQDKKRGGGGDFYLTQKKRLSVRFAGFVQQAVKRGKLNHQDAFELTGMKGKNYTTFMERFF